MGKVRDDVTGVHSGKPVKWRNLYQIIWKRYFLRLETYRMSCDRDFVKKILFICQFKIKSP